jgi:hypothetical protein
VTVQSDEAGKFNNIPSLGYKSGVENDKKEMHKNVEAIAAINYTNMLETEKCLPNTEIETSLLRRCSMCGVECEAQ